MPKIATVREHIAWSYANLARAHSALNDGRDRYGQVHHIVRAKLFKGLRTGTMHFGPLFDDERVKLMMPAGCAHCGTAEAATLDHLHAYVADVTPATISSWRVGTAIRRRVAATL